jgi:hypothetical protein
LQHHLRRHNESKDTVRLQATGMQGDRPEDVAGNDS